MVYLIRACGTSAAVPWWSWQCWRPGLWWAHPGIGERGRWWAPYRCCTSSSLHQKHHAKTSSLSVRKQAHIKSLQYGRTHTVTTITQYIVPNPIVVVLEIVFVWLKRMTLTQFFHTLKDDVLFIPTKQINFDIPLQEAEVYYLSVCAIFEAELLDDGLHPHLSVRWGILLSWQTKIGRECQVLPYGQSTHQNVILKDKQKEITLASNYLAINIQNMLCKIHHYTHLRSKVCVQ